MGSTFSWSAEIKDTLELPQHTGVAASVFCLWARRAASELVLMHGTVDPDGDGE
jgi:hypothetical protein